MSPQLRFPQCFSKALHNTISEALHNAISEALHNAISEALHNAISEALHNAISEALHNAISEALGSASFETASSVISEEQCMYCLRNRMICVSEMRPSGLPISNTLGNLFLRQYIQSYF